MVDIAVGEGLDLDEKRFAQVAGNALTDPDGDRCCCPSAMTNCKSDSTIMIAEVCRTTLHVFLR